jgi:hypothetical protein
MNFRLRSGPLAATTFSALLVLSVSALARELPGRPSPAAECRAWSEHYGDLLEQHRIAHEVDDATIAAAAEQFGTARAACFYGDFKKGLSLYETIPLGPVRTHLN